MSTALRCAIYSICTLLWLSGCAWLVMHFAFPTETDFGPAPNPWESVILRIHGFSLAGFAVVLVLSGYALYYTTDRFHDVAAMLHEVLGVVAIAFALTHWLQNRAFRSEP